MYQLDAALTDLTLADTAAAAATGELPRLPVLERLLARANRSAADRDWRRWALGRAGLTAPPGDLPVGRTLAGDAGFALDTASTWLVATPLHLVAGLSSVHLDPAGPVALSPAVAAALADRLARDWNDPAVTLQLAGATLLLRLGSRLDVCTRDPATLSGFGLGEAVARGVDAGPLERLNAELQMWLHGQALRGVDGREVNALWLWGSGSGALTGTSRWPALACDDPFLRAAAAGAPVAPDRLLEAWSVAALGQQGVAFAAADARWFAPLVARLADGELSSVRLHLAGAEFTLRARDRLRRWRRERPWWEWLD